MSVMSLGTERIPNLPRIKTGTRQPLGWGARHCKKLSPGPLNLYMAGLVPSAR